MGEWRNTGVIPIWTHYKDGLNRNALYNIHTGEILVEMKDCYGKTMYVSANREYHVYEEGPPKPKPKPQIQIGTAFLK